ncbi:hypothetical protein QBC38DRAFT_271849 [Podospora fimiseda]|uniref:Glycoside Hydrolase Family 76 n=1 Tax=Podospora fimiseda TaxID=252190 RepID=A0AAN7BKR6_9PEZI|nr:hypothetical protein QBC38DRAFT_271849 [Podospora fimiseda]
MVALKWGGLASQALHLLSKNQEQPTTAAQRALLAAKALQGWYNRSSGTWDTTGWWNSANCLTVLADWACLAKSDADSINIADIISNTFNAAQQVQATASKTISARGEVTSTYLYADTPPSDSVMTKRRGFPSFINDYYDDEGWWALALIRSWDVTRKQEYLGMAEYIFRDMQNGTDNVCGGGIWWSKDRKYKNAIANELYISVAASLANRVRGRETYYLGIATDAWTWFKSSGMINKDNLINDGLTVQADGSCVNNDMQTWSYNQGVILGGLVEMNRASVARRNNTLLDDASRIAQAAVNKLQDETGIIREIDRCEPNCGDDGLQFKGIFVRNLKYLNSWLIKDLFGDTIRRNADSIWEKNRNDKNQFGISWSGPVDAGRGPTAGTHTSAMDVLVAALDL